MAYNIGNTTVITNSAALGSVDGNSLNLANNANIPASGGDSYNVELFLVGGGGGGGREHNESGGGGHGGVVRTPVEVPVSTSFTITLGAGGAAQNSNAVDGKVGSASSAFGYTAAGGSGGRAGDAAQGAEGGSGPKPSTWGGGSTFQAAIITATHGFTNGYGGAGAHPNQGINNNNGGVGYQNLPNAQFAGGGGGHTYFTNYSGNSGGGAGSNGSNPGTGARGSGGGGGRQKGGAGGTGYCVIRYPGNAAIGSGGTVQVNGGYVYHTFNGSGTFNSGTP